MPTDHEDRIKNLMRAKVAHASLPLSVVRRAMEQGHRRRARRRALAGGTATLAVAVVAVGALNSTRGGQPSADETTTATAPTPGDQSTSADGALHAGPEAENLAGTSTFPLPYRDESDMLVEMLALMRGALLVTDENCLVLAPVADDAPIGLVWPLGWIARNEGDVVVVYDDKGNEWAREGQQVSVSGGFDSDYRGRPCAGDTPWVVSTGEPRN